MLTRHALARRWGTTVRTVDRRRRTGLLPWIDLTLGVGKRPQIRFRLEDVVKYEQKGTITKEENQDAAHTSL
jgi:hypothetical protein